MNTAIRQRIDKANQKIIEIDEKIKILQQDKRDTLKLIKQLEDEEFCSFCKGLDISIDVLNSDVELGKLIREAGLSNDDIKSLILGNKEEDKNENK